MIDRSRLWKNVASAQQKAEEAASAAVMRPLFEAFGGVSSTNKEAELSHVKSGHLMAASRAFREIDDDRAALAEWVNKEAKNREFLITALNADPVIVEMFKWEARWALGGFPTIDVSTSAYAASMCTTSVPGEMVSMVRAPWRAFMIRMPCDELLPIAKAHGGIEFARRILAREHLDSAGTRVWSYIVEGPSTHIFRSEIPTQEMCEPPIDEEFDSENGHGLYALEPVDARCLQMCAKLVIGACLSLETEGAHRPFAKRKGLSGLRSGRIPTSLRYQIGRPVHVDVSRHVRDFIENGGRKAPVTVQTLVRGHWKMQPHGEGRALRKFIHIEPHWRGPEDAPIAVRPHILNVSEKGAAE